MNLSTLSAKLKPFTKHLSWVMPVVAVIFQALSATHTLHLSVQDLSNLTVLLTSLGLGSVAHQVFGGSNGTSAPVA